MWLQNSSPWRRDSFILALLSVSTEQLEMRRNVFLLYLCCHCHRCQFTFQISIFLRGFFFVSFVKLSWLCNLSLIHFVLFSSPDLNCDELPAMTHGSFQVSGDYFGARVTYTCDDGFYMSGVRERVCQGDGSWSDSPPTCKREGKFTFIGYKLTFFFLTYYSSSLSLYSDVWITKCSSTCTSRCTKWTERIQHWCSCWIWLLRWIWTARLFQGKMSLLQCNSSVVRSWS